jgi:hypothetical protein
MKTKRDLILESRLFLIKNNKYISKFELKRIQIWVVGMHNHSSCPPPTELGSVPNE